MKWLWIALAALAALVALVALVGALLPKGHVASRRARFRQTPEALYDAIAGIAELPSWRGGLRSVEILPDRGGKRCYRETTSTGPMTLVVDVDERPRRRVTRIDDPELPFGGSWTFRIDPAPDGAELTITENGEVRNVIFRALARTVFGYEGALNAYLESLGKKFGESVAIEPGVPDPPPKA